MRSTQFSEQTAPARVGSKVRGAVLPLLFTLAGCSATEVGVVTYHQDVKQIIDTKCVSCHKQADGIGPFPLEDFAQVESMASLVRDSVVSRRMPPWLADDSCRDYGGRRSLSQDQINLVSAWVDSGALAGERRDVQASNAPADDFGIKRVDLTLSVPLVYTQKIEPDDYRCFLIEWPYDDVRYVTGFNAVPGNPAVVHHVVSFIIPPSQRGQFMAMDAADPEPGYTCFGGPGGSDFRSAFSVQWLSAWAPGSRGNPYPEGTGVRIEPGSLVALQVHYNSEKVGRQPDQSKLEFTIERTVEREARLVALTSPRWVEQDENGKFLDGMLIPAGVKQWVHMFEDDPSFLVGMGKEYDIWAAALHMHDLGVTATAEIVSSNGQQQCLLDIDRWDFDWQSFFWFTRPARFKQGDKLRVRCTFDNSPENQRFVNGVRKRPQDVIWGDGTNDEMCVAVIYAAAVAPSQP